MRIIDIKKAKKIYLPGRLQEALADSNAIIAGGTVRNVFFGGMQKDLDIYFRTQEDFLQFYEDLILKEATLYFVSNKAITFNHSGALCQAMFDRFYPTTKSLFEAFDFTVIMGAYDVKERAFYLHERFAVDNSSKELIFNKNTSYPLCSLLRVSKYTGYGFSISKSQLLRIFCASYLVNIDSYEALEEEVGGMYGVSLDDILDKSVPFDLSQALDRLLNYDYNAHGVASFDAEFKEVSRDTLKEKIDGIFKKDVVDDMLF